MKTIYSINIAVAVNRISLAFGVVPAGTLFPNATESFNKNIFFMTLTWICIAYDRYAKKMSQRRALG